MKPFLSIIIPVYHIKEEYLRTCFDSLIAQDMTEFRVIAVDDGSPDHCGQICDEYAGKDERFSVIHQENAGAAAARNRGLEVLDTEWVAFVDPDDWVERNHVSTLYRAAQEHRDIDIFLFDYIQEYAERSSARQLMDQSRKLDAEWTGNLKLAPFHLLTVDGKPFEYETNTLWNKMYRASLIERVHLRFDPRARKGQDVIFNAECFQLTNRFYYLQAPLYHYRYLQNSITNRFNQKAQYYNEVAFEHYERIIKQYNLPGAYEDAFHARVVTRMYSAMRLYYFHPENKAAWRDVTKELDGTLEREPYQTALEKVRYTDLTGSQAVFVYFLKRKWYGVLRLLVHGRLVLKQLRGEKLT